MGCEKEPPPKLYTLALSYFQVFYSNYFEHPELPKLHNRSGELWWPLVALAAFFEEQGGVIGLLDAIFNAAEWDKQISEGKSLSEREEAVLQLLNCSREVVDMMQRYDVPILHILHTLWSFLLNTEGYVGYLLLPRFML